MMIIIESMKTVEVKGDQHTLTSLLHEDMYNPLCVETARGTELMSREYVQEIIRGRRFITPKGSIIIGVTKEVQELLGITYEAWENVNQELGRLGRENSGLIRRLVEERAKTCSLEDEVLSLKQASLWVRIKWLFTEVKI